jgi:hypothetical protein
LSASTELLALSFAPALQAFEENGRERREDLHYDQARRCAAGPRRQDHPEIRGQGLQARRHEDGLGACTFPEPTAHFLRPTSRHVAHFIQPHPSLTFFHLPFALL